MKKLMLLFLMLLGFVSVGIGQTAGTGFDLRDPSIDLTTEEINAIVANIAGSTDGIDFDADGKYEIVIRADNTADADCQIRIYEFSADNSLTQQGSGVKIAVTTRQTGYIRGLLVGNFDGDASNEIAVSYEGGNGSEKIEFFDVSETFVLTSLGSILTGDDCVGIAYLGDTDGDTRPEFVFGNIAASNSLRVMEWDGTSSWTLVSQSSPTGGLQSMDAGNTDGDGNIEIFGLYDTSGLLGLVGYEFASGTLTADATVSNNVGANAGTKTHTHIKIADVDGDTDKEVIVVVNDNDGSGAGTVRALYVFENTGSSNYDRDETAATGLFSQADRITSVAVGDQDSDGNPEIYYSIEATASGSVLYREHNAGSANSFLTSDFSAATTLVSSMGTNIEAGAIAFGYGSNSQLDGDLYRDIVIGTLTTTTKDIYFIESQTEDGALPVELTSFTAKTTKAGVMLNWTTVTEVNNFGFDVETLRATSSKWEKVGFVEGHGNSNSPKEYSFFDNSGATSYRLKQVDFNGNYEYSDVVTVKASLAKTELYQNSPNPFNPSTKISFSLAETGKVNVSVYNVIGQKVADLVNQTMESGVHNVDFNASNLPSGLYIYRLDTPNYSKTMKMMLLK